MNPTPTPPGSRQPPPHRPSSSNSSSSKSKTRRPSNSSSKSKTRHPSASAQARPSPLSQVTHSTDGIPRPFSVAPSVTSLAASEPRGDVTLVQDPVFWKRFSQAIHEADSTEELKKKARESKVGGRGNRVSGFSGKDTWLQQQRREKRRCRFICVLITAIAIAIIVAVVVVLVVVLKV